MCAVSNQVTSSTVSLVPLLLLVLETLLAAHLTPQWTGVDFNTMTQTNLRTNKCRKIRRVAM
jgi:hypothetical protein